jgi:hypothetical protein
MKIMIMGSGVATAGHLANVPAKNFKIALFNTFFLALP